MGQCVPRIVNTTKKSSGDNSTLCSSTTLSHSDSSSKLSGNSLTHSDNNVNACPRSEACNDSSNSLSENTVPSDDTVIRQETVFENPRKRREARYFGEQSSILHTNNDSISSSTIDEPLSSQQTDQNWEVRIVKYLNNFVTFHLLLEHIFNKGNCSK